MVECCPKEQRKDVAASLLIRLPMGIFAIVMIVIGHRNMPDEKVVQCTGAPELPVLLVVGGVILLVAGFWRQVVISCCQCCDNKLDGCETGFNLMKCGVLVLYDLCYISIATGWCIAASILLSKAMDDKVPFSEGVDGVCETEVYNMTMASIVVGFVSCCLAFLFLVVGRLCCNILFCKACDDEPETQPA